MTLNIIMAARGEAQTLPSTITRITNELLDANIGHRFWIGLDCDHESVDNTLAVAREFGARVVVSAARGYGRAVRVALHAALDNAPDRDWYTIMTADGSDSARDLIAMYRRATDWAAEDMIFGDRWHRVPQGTGVWSEYPLIKRWVNRFGNHLAALVIGENYSDWTNPFKLYRRDVIKSALPRCRANDFSFGMELALRAVWQGWPYVVLPTSWFDRTAGTSKFRAKHAWGFLSTLWRLYREVRRGVL